MAPHAQELRSLGQLEASLDTGLGGGSGAGPLLTARAMAVAGVYRGLAQPEADTAAQAAAGQGRGRRAHRPAVVAEAMGATLGAPLAERSRRDSDREAIAIGAVWPLRPPRALRRLAPRCCSMTRRSPAIATRCGCSSRSSG